MKKILSLTANYLSIIIDQGGVLPNVHSELLPKQTEGDGDRISSIELHRDIHGHPMVVMESMANDGNEKKILSPVEKSLEQSASSKKNQ